MFNVDPSELMLLAAVALVVIGPKDLPRAMRFVGQWVARARGMARHFRMGVDEIIRSAELEEMQKKWAAENARIMSEHPTPPPEEADDVAFAFPGDGRAMTALPYAGAEDDTAWPPVDRSAKAEVAPEPEHPAGATEESPLLFEDLPAADPDKMTGAPVAPSKPEDAPKP